MTIEEKRQAIEEKCYKEYEESCNGCPLKDKLRCYSYPISDEQINENYDLMFPTQNKKVCTLDYEAEYIKAMEELKIERSDKQELYEKYKSLSREAEIMRAQLDIFNLVFKKE